MNEEKLDEILEQHYWDISSMGWKEADAVAKERLNQLYKDSLREELGLLPNWNNCKCNCLSCQVIGGRLEQLKRKEP